jgi:SAM-dependent methyltransferase
VISSFLRAIARCPSCLASGDGSTPTPTLEPDSEPAGGGLHCPKCGRSYPAHDGDGYLDLRPPAETFSDLTEYAEEEFHHREGPLRPLFLSARVKMDVMTSLLKPGASDRVLDIGCGNGRFVFFERHRANALVGIDAGAHFAPEPLASVDLTRGDIRLLPFADGSFDKAYSLDVLEHLTEDGVLRMLAEARRVLKPGGQLFLYSHVMMSSRIASFQRGVNRLVRWLDKKGLVDNEPERQRKSDHRNALRSYEQLDAVLAKTGFEIETIRYYNVVFKAVIEDLILPLVEHNLYSRRRSNEGDESHHETYEGNSPHAHSHSHSHSHASTKPDVGSWAHVPLTLASYLMKLDVLLFGRIRTGPFFLLLRAV